MPDVGTAQGGTVIWATHIFDGNIAGDDQQVSPREFVAVLLFDGPEQAACFVEVAVVGPAVEWCKALCAGARAATAITDAVGAGCVPGHANEQRSIVTIICRPPCLAIAHDGTDVRLD